MKLAVTYLLLAIFCWLVVQPNLIHKASPAPERIPENSNVGSSSDEVFEKTSTSKATIVIDPGRGGKDTGYQVPGEYAEKDIAMQLAVNIGSALENAGYNVKYTRWYDDLKDWSDDLSSDQNRLIAARNQKADYLLSLRFNTGSYADKGFSLFTRPDNSLLTDLSSAIASNIKITSYSSYEGLDTEHYANFPILSDEKLPAILVQMGYLTNSEDYAKITDDAFQKKLGEAIASAFLEVVD